MKILFVFTGGTIGSTSDGKYISPDAKKPYSLLDAYSRRYGVDFDYTVCEPYRALSENNTGKELKMLICAIESAKSYDGIIVTHGTDTLQYTAAALGYCFGNACAPICIVSSNYPIEDERANGICNLHAAIELIKTGYARGVFVPYRNQGENITRIHRATRLLPHDAFSDTVRSVKGIEYGYFADDGSFAANSDFTELSDELSLPSIDKLCEQATEIVRMQAFVGMTYPTLDDSVRYVIIDAYHSGTVDTVSQGARAFFEEARARGIKVFLSGAYGGEQYGSAIAFEELSIVPIKDISPISLYIKLWLYSLDREVDARLLSKSRAGDIC